MIAQLIKSTVAFAVCAAGIVVIFKRVPDRVAVENTVRPSAAIGERVRVTAHLTACEQSVLDRLGEFRQDHAAIAALIAQSERSGRCVVHSPGSVLWVERGSVLNESTAVRAEGATRTYWAMTRHLREKSERVETASR